MLPGPIFVGPAIVTSEQPTFGTDLHVCSNVTKGADFRSLTDHGGSVHNRAGMDERHLSTSPKAGVPPRPPRHSREATAGGLAETLGTRQFTLIKSVSPGITGLRNFTSSALMK